MFPILMQSQLLNKCVQCIHSNIILQSYFPRYLIEQRLKECDRDSPPLSSTLLSSSPLLSPDMSTLEILPSDPALKSEWLVLTTVDAVERAVAVVVAAAVVAAVVVAAVWLSVELLSRGLSLEGGDPCPVCPACPVCAVCAVCTAF